VARPTTIKGKCTAVETLSGGPVAQYQYTYEVSADGGSTAVSELKIITVLADFQAVSDSLSQMLPTIGSGL
jgi:hypothetical protein